MTWSPREQALDIYPAAVNAPLSALGADKADLKRSAADLLDRTEVLIQKAIEGPARRSAFEPSDEDLQRMLARVQARREQVDAR